MAQARRIKPRSTRKKAPNARKARSLLNIQWGLVLVILVSGVVLGLLFSGANSGDKKFGAGLKKMLENYQPEAGTGREIAALIESKSSEKEFGFYEDLKDIEKLMPDDLPEAEPIKLAENLDYYVQAASFREYTDAEKLRARLALKGFKSVTQAREMEGRGTYYRVRLGPYADKRKAKTAKNKLQKVGVRPFVYTVKR